MIYDVAEGRERRYRDESFLWKGEYRDWARQIRVMEESLIMA